MSAPPTFASRQEYSSRLDDVGFWWPSLAEILERHDLVDASHEPASGVGGTYPTFLYGDVVVKLFGYVRSWRESYAAERGAHVLVATDPEIVAPNLLFDGQLSPHHDTTWPYLITTRMSGVAWIDAKPTGEQRLMAAAELGRQIRRMHRLYPLGVANDASFPSFDVVAAAKQSSLPPHLITQIDDYLAQLGPFDRVFTHSDITDRHVFIENGRLAGIIDWGDAIVTDRHYELCKVADLFDYDKALLRALLETSDWPVGNDFPRLALGLAIYRQAQCLAQHLTSDAFHKLPALLPLQDIGTLNELATELFAV